MPEDQQLKIDNLLTKFKMRKGKFKSLPFWTSSFEKEVKCDIEEVAYKVKVTEKKLNRELDDKLL